MSEHTTFEKNGFTLCIEYDDCVDSPDEHGNTDYFLGETTHLSFSVMGRSGCDKDDAADYIAFGEGPWDFEGSCDLIENADTEEELREHWEDRARNLAPQGGGGGFEVFPVHLHDGRGSSSSLSFCDHEDAHAYIYIKVPWGSDLEKLAHLDHDALRIAGWILEEWNTYLSGDVHWACMKDSDGEVLESCGGFYGIEQAKEWCEENAAAYKEDTRPVTILVTTGTPLLPFPCGVGGDIHSIEVPICIGEGDIASWALAEGPFKGNNNILQVSVYTGPAPVGAKAVMNG